MTLDELPLATIAFIVFALCGVYAFISSQITFEELGTALGLGGVGTAAIGEVRNRAGKGTRR